MVRLSSLSKILNFINENNLQVMKRWSERFHKDGRRRRSNTFNFELIGKIRRLLEFISGNDIVKMLKDVLNREEKMILSDEKNAALKNLSNCYKKTNLKKRHYFADALKKSRIRYYEARNFGFNVSKKLWRTCHNNHERNKGGRKQLKPDLQKNIKEYLEQKSTVASNRLVHVEKELVHVRYLEERQIELYKKFPDNDRKLRTIVVDLNKGLTNYGYKRVETGIDAENAKSILRDKRQEILRNNGDLTQIKKLSELIGEYEAIVFHKNVAIIQREAYKKHHDVAGLKNNILIEVDFKQKIKIGMSPRQVNTEYYNQQDRSCLGFGVYYVETSADNIDQVKCINFDIISSDLAEDSFATIRGFRCLREQEFFKKIENNFQNRPINYIIWADCGKHFRNQNVMGYFFNELKDLNIQVNVNFFGDHHGKNARDAHFSNVSKFVKDMSLIKQLTCSKDVVDAINFGQKKANENIKKNKKPINTIAISLDEDQRKELAELERIKPVVITNIESFHNYRTIRPDFEIVTSVLSNGSENETEKIKLIIKNPESITDTYYDPIPEEIINKDDLKGKIGNLLKKKERIIATLTRIKDIAIKHNKFDINSDLFKFLDTNNFFSNVVENFVEDESNDNNEVNQDLEFPAYCRPNNEKKPCKECKAACSIKMENLLSEDKKIRTSQTDIINELLIHGHPSSRIMPHKKQRVRAEAAEELADHYEYFHNKKRPRFN